MVDISLLSVLINVPNTLKQTLFLHNRLMSLLSHELKIYVIIDQSGTKGKRVPICIFQCMSFKSKTMLSKIMQTHFCPIY